MFPSGAKKRHFPLRIGCKLLTMCSGLFSSSSMSAGGMPTCSVRRGRGIIIWRTPRGSRVIARNPGVEALRYNLVCRCLPCRATGLVLCGYAGYACCIMQKMRTLP